MHTSKVSKKGQIVIPAELRRKLGFKEGIKVAISETERGVEVQPMDKAYFDQFAGILGGDGDITGELLRERRRDREREEADF